MIWNAGQIRRDAAWGRWQIVAFRRGRRWIIIVEPVPAGRILKVLTLFVEQDENA